MDFRLKILLILAVVGVFGVKASPEAFWYQLHDGVSRLEKLNDANFDAALGSASMMVVWYHSSSPEGTVDATQQKMALIYENMLEMTSQFLFDKDVKVGTVNIQESPETHKLSGSPEAGSVLVFKQGKPHPYLGYRSAELLLSFIRAVNSTALRVIDSKMTKKDFDAVDTTKVVAYLTPGTAVYTEYEAAAHAMHPTVPFFVVTDPQYVPKVKLNTTGEMYVLRPGDAAKELIPPEVAATATGIQDFVLAKGKNVFSILTLNDLHAFGDCSDPNVHQVVAFSRRQSQEARPFFKALKNVVRQFANDTRLKVTVIDPDMLPMMALQLEAKFGIDVSRPALGYINFQDNTQQWMDLSLFHQLPDQVSQRVLLTNWINTVVLAPPAQVEPVDAPVAADAAATSSPVICLPNADGSQHCLPLAEATAALNNHLNNGNNNSPAQRDSQPSADSQPPEDSQAEDSPVQDKAIKGEKTKK